MKKTILTTTNARSITTKTIKRNDCIQVAWKMSFFDLEAQRSGSSFTRDDSLAMNKTYRQFMEFTDELKKLERECIKVGTKRDSLALRDHIETTLIPQCSTIRDSIEETLWNSSDEQWGKGSKIYNDFLILKETLLKQERRYRDMKLKNVLKRESKNAVPGVREDPSSGYVSIKVNEQTPLLVQEESYGEEQQQKQQQQQLAQAQLQNSSLQNEIDFNSIIQRERSQQINRIHSAVQEVNAIFHQLGSLVNEQGEQVDTIDGNIGHFSNNVQKANEQLNRADEHQRKRNKCGLVTLVIMVVVVLVVILAVIT